MLLMEEIPQLLIGICYLIISHYSPYDAMYVDAAGICPLLAPLFWLGLGCDHPSPILNLEFPGRGVSLRLCSACKFGQQPFVF